MVEIMIFTLVTKNTMNHKGHEEFFLFPIKRQIPERYFLSHEKHDELKSTGKIYLYFTKAKSPYRFFDHEINNQPKRTLRFFLVIFIKILQKILN
jgi:hypothetical protein